MNERIKELALDLVEQCDWNPPHDPTYYTFAAEDLEKFAELIVRECEQVSLKSSHRDDDMGAIIAKQIREHFGVK